MTINEKARTATCGRCEWTTTGEDLAAVVAAAKEHAATHRPKPKVTK